MRAKLFRQVRQDSVDFFDLFDLKLTNAIACFDGCGRLDEESAACGRRVVHDSADGASRFSSYGNNEATIADCHRHVGNALMGLELSHGTFEKLDQLPLRTLQLAAKLLESGRRIVSNLRVFVNRALDRVLDPLVDEKRSDLAGEYRRHH